MQPTVITIAADLSALSSTGTVSSSSVTTQQVVGTAVLTGPQGPVGRNPLTVSATAPSSPQIGDLWYQP